MCSGTGAGSAGTANKGGGGGGGLIAGSMFAGKAGGSGVVIVKELQVARASGVWSMAAVYQNVKAGTWT